MIHREYSIFYSWQSDANPEYNWRFIRSALDLAVEEIKGENGFDIPVVESGMERVGGSPELATIMFEKIRAAAIVVADASLVGEIDQHGHRNRKKTANPNVLMEIAYAGAKIGWQRVICVMNTSFGAADKLPVDIRNRRWPIRYTLGERNKGEIEALKCTLANDFKAAIDAIAYRDFQAVIDAGKRLDINCIRVIDGYRCSPYFHTMPGIEMAFVRLDNKETVYAAIPRLLDLGLIVCDYDSRQDLYAYHWTFLGRMYLRHHWPNDIPDWLAGVKKDDLADPPEDIETK